MAESTIDSYNKKAFDYETKWSAYLTHTHERFLDHLETVDDDILLDVSGGTGLLAQMLIERDYPFHRLVVNDPSEKMLSIAQQRLSDNEQVHFSNSNADNLTPYEDRFDRIFCLNAFHFYPNQQQVLKKFYAILKPGGHLYILDWNRAGFFRLINWIFKWSTSEYIDTRSLPELQSMLEHEDFEILMHRDWRWRYWRFLLIESQKPKNN